MVKVCLKITQRKVTYPISTFFVLSNNLGFHLHPPHIYLFIDNNKNARKRFEIRLKLTVKTPKPGQ